MENQIPSTHMSIRMHKKKTQEQICVIFYEISLAPSVDKTLTRNMVRFRKFCLKPSYFNVGHYI